MEEFQVQVEFGNQRETADLTIQSIRCALRANAAWVVGGHSFGGIVTKTGGKNLTWRGGAFNRCRHPRTSSSANPAWVRLAALSSIAPKPGWNVERTSWVQFDPAGSAPHSSSGASMLRPLLVDHPIKDQRRAARWRRQAAQASCAIGQRPSCNRAAASSCCPAPASSQWIRTCTPCQTAAAARCSTW